MIKGSNLTDRVVDEALSAGYRLFDTANIYKNEKDFGEAFKKLLDKHNLTRNDIFITTKIRRFQIKIIFIKKFHLKFLFRPEFDLQNARRL